MRSSISVTGSSSLAISLATDNQLDLELESGEEVEGGIRVHSAGDDTSGQTNVPRKHRIVVEAGGMITTD